MSIIQGSKYDDALRAKAVAMCTNPKMNPAKVAKELGIPRSTVYDWYRSDQSSDPDLVAIKRNKIRNLMDKAYSVASRSIDGLDKQSKVLKLEKKQIDKALSKLLSDEELDDETRELMAEIVKNYTGTSMTDVMKISKESIAIAEKFENMLAGEKSNTGTSVNIYFADEVKE